MSWLRAWASKDGRDELTEKRPLPVGVTEFHDWSDRIIKAAGLPSRLEDQKYVLANVICNNCGPAVAFESDAYFIAYLRKVAANQVADEMRKRIKEQRTIEQNQAAASAPPGANAEVVPIKGV
jgi:hypothetical protein